MKESVLTEERLKSTSFPLWQGDITHHLQQRPSVQSRKVAGLVESLSESNKNGLDYFARLNSPFSDTLTGWQCCLSLNQGRCSVSGINSILSLPGEGWSWRSSLKNSSCFMGAKKPARSWKGWELNTGLNIRATSLVFFTFYSCLLFMEQRLIFDLIMHRILNLW